MSGGITVLYEQTLFVLTTEHSRFITVTPLTYSILNHRWTNRANFNQENISGISKTRPTGQHFRLGKTYHVREYDSRCFRSQRFSPALLYSTSGKALSISTRGCITSTTQSRMAWDDG